MSLWFFRHHLHLISFKFTFTSVSHSCCLTAALGRRRKPWCAWQSAAGCCCSRASTVQLRQQKAQEFHFLIQQSKWESMTETRAASCSWEGLTSETFLSNISNFTAGFELAVGSCFPRDPDQPQRCLLPANNPPK